MSQNKQSRREILEIEARVNELDRAQPYLDRGFYKERKTQLLERKDELQDKLNKKEIAPDVQFLEVVEVIEENPVTEQDTNGILM